MGFQLVQKYMTLIEHEEPKCVCGNGRLKSVVSTCLYSSGKEVPCPFGRIPYYKDQTFRFFGLHTTFCSSLDLSIILVHRLKLRYHSADLDILYKDESLRS